jgi:endonuclease YncB( thermonuclease family)
MGRASAAHTVGTARVVDGDTTVVKDITIRLKGIDALEQARMMATYHLAALRAGIDPLADRDAGRDAVTVVNAA